MEYNFLAYSEKYFTSLVHLLDICFSIKAPDKEALVNWKLFSKLRGEPIVYIATSKDAVIGTYTSIPWLLKFDDQTFKATTCIDMATHPDHRRQGIIKKLSELTYKEVSNKDYVCSFGYSNESGVQVDLNADGYGYYVVGKFEKLYKPIVRHKETKFLAKQVNSFQNLDLSSIKYFQILKDQDYLNWRYLQKPNNDYKVYEVNSNDNLIGYIVLRIRNSNCYVYDIISTNMDTKTLKAILDLVENIALSQGCRVAIYNILMNAFWEKVFSKKYIKLPSNKNKYYFTLKIHKDKFEKGIILDKENWLLTTGDIV